MVCHAEYGNLQPEFPRESLAAGSHDRLSSARLPVPAPGTGPSPPSLPAFTLRGAAPDKIYPPKGPILLDYADID